jgi:RimJ/RimL family protein N-acetyltransferase
VPEVPGRRSGLFVVELGGAMIGVITLDRRDTEHPEAGEGEEAELGYLFLPAAWGRGYAAEACAAVLRTQTANERAMRLAAKPGFTEVERFEEWDAEQWFGAWSAVATTG